MATIHELPTPALLLDLDVLERNLRRMSERAASLGVALRPHIKTHKSVEVAGLQRSLGIAGITVSTLYEARVFADHGFTDVTWAFPVILTRLEEVRELADRMTLRLVVDSPEALEALERLGRPLLSDGGAFRRVRGGPRRPGGGPLEDLARPVGQGAARW